MSLLTSLHICVIILHTKIKGGYGMIINIEMSLKNDIIQARKELYERLALANDDRSAIADYLDYFDMRCVPLAIKALPKKIRKRYEAKQAGLVAGLSSIKDKVGDDERRMYSHMKTCAYRFNKFVQGAYYGVESVSSEPIEQLFKAELSSTISRTVYTALEPKYKQKYFGFIESEEEM